MDNDENDINPDVSVGVPTNASGKKWLKWAGIGAFMFFLIKGLAWLIVPAVLLWWGTH